MEINNYRDLLELADLSSIYSQTKPLTIKPEDYDFSQHNFFKDIKVKENNDFVTKKICSDKKIYFLYEPNQSFEFNDGKNIQQFDKNDLVLISCGESLISSKWSVSKVEDVLNFNNDFERINYGDYDIEKESIDSLKQFKCEYVFFNMEEQYKKDLQKLKEKSSIPFGLKLFKKS